jgi:hypothetical protein
MTTMKRWAIGMSLAALAVAGLQADQLQTPSDWRWRTDDPATLVQGQDLPANGWRFVAMPPGWHITTGPGALLYHPDYQGRGNFSVEAEVFLFPGTSQEEYGVFLGGRDLEPTASPSYIAFVARRDGRAAVIRRGGTSPIVDWKTNDAVLPHPGADTVKNVFRVDVNPGDVVFSANGKTVITLPRAGLNLDGLFGFRIGAGMNIHASRLDVTHRLAPLPIK